MIRLLSSVFVCGLLLVGCGQTSQSSNPTAKAKQFTPDSSAETSEELTVSAAASLTDAMEDIKELYRQQQPKTNITYNFASSGSLQQQIEQGAPVDVFVSAASKQMNELEAKQMLKNDTRKNLLENQVVLVVPADAENISDFQDLTNDRIEKIAIGEPDSVPVGEYAKEVLSSLNIFEQLEPKMIFAKSVLQVLTYVETGNVDAGIVYATDAKKSDRVKVVAVAPEASHSPVIYPVAVIKEAQNPDAGDNFAEFLSSRPAGDIFEKHGFTLTEEFTPTK